MFGNIVDKMAETVFTKDMTNHPNSFAAIYANEVAKFASLGADQASAFAAKNVAEQLGLSYTKVRELAGMVAA